jgi:hypothetical protein
MQPLHELTNEQKAILLHQLLPGEIRMFLTGLQLYAGRCITQANTIKRNWKHTEQDANAFLNMARQAVPAIKDQLNALATSPELFASELFTDKLVFFTLTYLPQHGSISGYRFRDAVKLLFDLKPVERLPFQDDEK